MGRGGFFILRWAVRFCRRSGGRTSVRARIETKQAHVTVAAAKATYTQAGGVFA